MAKDESELKLGGKTFKEWKIWKKEISNPSHPDYEKWKPVNQKMAEKWSKIIPMLQSASVAMKEADNVANVLLKLSEKGTIEDFANLPPIPGLVVLSLIAQANDKTAANAQKILSDQQSKIARKPRSKRQHPNKLEVYDYWKRWQKEPALYQSQAAFIKDMQDKAEINRGETLRCWIEDWKKEMGIPLA